MKRAWEPDPLVRPSMDSIYKILRREICVLRDGDDSGLEHTRRRSAFVLNRDSAAPSTDTDGARVSKHCRRASGTRPPNVLDQEAVDGRAKPSKTPMAS